MHEPQLPENSLLRMFKTSRGMCDVCCPFLESVPFCWPRPCPPATRQGCLCLTALYGEAILWKLLHSTRQAPSLHRAAPLGVKTLLLIPSSAFLNWWHLKHPRTQICSVVYGRVTKTPNSVLNSSKGVPGEDCWETIFLCSGCHNKVPQKGWLEPQKFNFSQFWKLEVQDLGVNRVGFSWGLSPWLSDGCLLFFVLAWSSLCACPTLLSPPRSYPPLLINDTSQIGLEATLKTPF